jgi:hypothetical protein
LILLSRNAQGGYLAMNKLSICINIMHYFNSFYCMPDTFFFLYLQSVVSIKEHPFIWGGWNALGFYRFFLLPSYAEARALTLMSLASPPSRIGSWCYDLGVKNYIDDEALKNVLDFFWTREWIIRFMNPLGGPKVGWRALMMFLCFAPNFAFISIFTQS